MMVIATILQDESAYSSKHGEILLPRYSKHLVRHMEVFPLGTARVTLDLGDDTCTVDSFRLDLELVIEAKNGLPERRVAITPLDLRSGVVSPLHGYEYTDDMPSLYADTVVF